MELAVSYPAYTVVSYPAQPTVYRGAFEVDCVP